MANWYDTSSCHSARVTIHPISCAFQHPKHTIWQDPDAEYVRTCDDRARQTEHVPGSGLHSILCIMVFMFLDE